MQCIDVAYCYAGHNHKLYKNGQTNQGVIYGLGWSKEPCIRWRPVFLMGRDSFGGIFWPIVENKEYAAYSQYST